MNPVAPVTATFIVRSRSWGSADDVWTRCGTVARRVRATAVAGGTAARERFQVVGVKPPPVGVHRDCGVRRSGRSYHGPTGPGRTLFGAEGRPDGRGRRPSFHTGSLGRGA